MAVLTIKNPGGSPFFISDVGIIIPATGQDTFTTFIHDEMIRKLGGSRVTRDAALAGTLVINNGTSDLSPVNGERYLELRWILAGFDTFPSGFSAGFQTFAYGMSSGVPASGTRQMRTAGTSLVGYTVNRPGTITGGGFRVDIGDASRTYNLEIYINGALATSFLLALNQVLAFSTSLSTPVVAGDEVELFVTRASGAGASTFNDAAAWIEVTV